ncbi:MAG: hypothetical protein R2940_09075 [Syntrophotaleaceae bacterium]
MLPPTPSAIPPDLLWPWLVVIGFGAFHGINPGMGWLFALSLGLQKKSARAVWLSLLPIAAGHALSVGLVALLILAGIQLVSTTVLQLVTADLLLVFGLYKLVNYYRHPRWVGMKVNLRDLFWWSFLMATAHGAGLMVAPAFMEFGHRSPHAHHMQPGIGLFLAVVAHTLAMLLVMGSVAWIVYRRFSLAILRRNWINFDLIWAAALLIVGVIALITAF